MPTEAKRETIESLKGELARSTTLIVSEYRGLKVSEIAEIRRALRKHEVGYRVVKNRLARIAVDEGTDGRAAALSPLLVGPTAIAFASGDESTAAKAVIDAIRPYKVVRITGAVLGDRAIGGDQVAVLATLPSRAILQAKLAGAIQAPIANLAGLLGANLRNLGYALSAVRDQKIAAGG
jgi:large subunit ribosomal protein L10